MKLPVIDKRGEKAGVCTFCNTGVMAGECHAELKLSVRREPSAPGPVIHHGLLMVCHRCSAELGLAGARPPQQTLMRIVHELIVREEFAAAVPEPEPFQLESYEPDTGLTDDGLEIPPKAERPFNRKEFQDNSLKVVEGAGGVLFRNPT